MADETKEKLEPLDEEKLARIVGKADPTPDAPRQPETPQPPRPPDQPTQQPREAQPPVEQPPEEQQQQRPQQAPHGQDKDQPSLTLVQFKQPPDRTTVYKLMGVDEIISATKAQQPAHTPQPAPYTESPPRALGGADLDDQTAKARRAVERDKTGGSALERILAEYPTTKFVNVRLFWKDPRTNEFREKGRRKRVSINDIRDASELLTPIGGGTPYGGDYVIAYQAADQGLRFDDPKTWHRVEFSRDGPPPPRDWVIDAAPPEEDEVELKLEDGTMATVSLNELKDAVSGAVSGSIEQAMRRLLEQIVGDQRRYASPAPQVHDERMQLLEKMNDELRRELNAVREAQMKAEREALETKLRMEKEAAEAKHRAELEAIRTSSATEISNLKSTMERTLEALRAELAAVAAKASTPPQPTVDQSVMVATAIKDILAAGKEQDRSALEREREMWRNEREREREERERERLREQQEAERRRAEEERERERRRAEEERERARFEQEMRERFEMYKTMGELVRQAQNPGPIMEVIRGAGEQLTNQVRMFATMVERGLLGGGGGENKINWGEVIGSGFEMLGNLGVSIAEAARAKAEASAAMSSAALPPSAGTPLPQPPAQPASVPQTQQQPMSHTQPVSAVSPAPSFSGMRQTAPQAGPPQHQQPSREIKPIQAFIYQMNQAISRRDPPERVAEMVAAIAYAAQVFGAGDPAVARALEDLLADPARFLKRSYARIRDDAYLEQVARAILAGPGKKVAGTEGRERTGQAARGRGSTGNQAGSETGSDEEDPESEEEENEDDEDEDSEDEDNEDKDDEDAETKGHDKTSNDGQSKTESAKESASQANVGGIKLPGGSPVTVRFSRGRGQRNASS